MGSIPKSTKVILIPWDPDSPTHVERMKQQRIACGWHQESVPEWQPRQQEGKKNIQWVVLDDSIPEKDEYIIKHISTFPSESIPLTDTATSLGAKPRSPSPSFNFIPVGHISLDTEYHEEKYGESSPGTYFIATFYISGALQGCGIGRAAMDIIEETAIAEPLLAKRLALSTPNTDDPERIERFKAHGKELPKVTNARWYERRGYEVYRKVSQMWPSEDLEGKTWWVPGVFMRKDIA